MKNKKKPILIFNLLIILLTNILIFNQKVNADFPTQLGPIYTSSNAVSPTGVGYRQTYKYDNGHIDDNGKKLAVFCTDYYKSTPYGKTCNLSNSWGIKTQIGVATIIDESNFQNKDLSTINNTDVLKESLNVTTAINCFLGKTSLCNALPQNYKDIVNHAYTNFNNYGDPSIDLQRADGGNVSYLYNPSATENTINSGNNPVRIFKIEYDHLTQKKITVLRGNKVIPEGVSINIYVSNDPNSFSSTPDANLTNTNIDISNKITSSPSYIKLELQDDRTEKTEFNVIPRILAEGSETVKIAQKYSCGSNIQTVTPNYTETLTKSDSTSIPFNIRGMSTPEYPQIKVTKKDKETGNNINSWSEFNLFTVDENNNAENPVRIIINNNGQGSYNLWDSGKYCIREIKAPTGYKINNSKVCFEIGLDNSNNIIYSASSENNQARDFELNYDSTTNTINFTLKDEPIKVTLNKIFEDGYNGQESEFIITNEKGSTIPYEFNGTSLTWNTKNDGITKEYKGLPAGTYYLYEINTADGYIKEELPQIITIANRETSDKTIDVYNYLIKINIRKVDQNQQNLANAEFRILDQDKNRILDATGKDKYSWKSGETDHTIVGIKAGKYYLEEVNPPKGYSKNDLIGFTITEEGNVILDNEISNGSTDETIIVSNEKNQIKVKKISNTDNKPLRGAQLQLLDNDGNIIKLKKSTDNDHLLYPDANGFEYWETDEKEVTIEQIPIGKYKIKEIKAPDGYVLSDSVIEFEVNAKGKVIINKKLQNSNTLIMSNNETEVYISKQDITNKGTELPGAELILKDADGVEIDRWTSGTEPYLIKGLGQGTYTLTEISAPDGYSVSEETVTFTIDENGALSGNTIMYNTPIPEVPSTLSTKSLIIIITGFIVISSGAVLYFYSLKKRNQI